MSTRVAVARVASLVTCVLPLLFLLAVCAGADAAATRVVEYPLAVDGDYAVVGAPWQDDFQGAAYILKRSGDRWGEPLLLSPPDLGRFDHFGASVSISGDYAVVSAPWQDLFRGAAYVFKRDGDEWVFVQKLTGIDDRPDNQFGRTVLIEGDNIAIGSVAAGSRETGTLGVYQFSRIGDEWVQREVDIDPAMASRLRNPDGFGIAAVADRDGRTLTEHLDREIGPPPILPAADTQPPEWVNATDSVFENRVEIAWSSVGEDAIIYGILRDGRLISLASSDDSLYIDERGDPGVVYQYCLIIVDDVNEPPVMFPIGTQSVTEGQSLNLVVSAWDPDGDSLILSAEGVPLNATFTDTWNNRGIFEFNPDLAQSGTYVVTFIASDGAFADTGFVEIFVYDGGSQSAGLSQIAPEQGDKDQSLDFALSAVAGIPCDEGSRIIFPPAGVSASDGLFDKFVRVRWTDMSAIESAYIIRRDGAEIDTVEATAASVFDDITAVPEVVYGYEIIAIDTAGNRARPIGDDGFRGLIMPPLAVSASDGEFPDHVMITWTDQANNEVGYIINRDGVVLDSTAANASSYKDFAAVGGVAHDYCVRTYGLGDTVSIEVCDKGGVNILPVPKNVNATDSKYDDRVEITWGDASDLEDGYEIRRDGTVIDSVGANVGSYTDEEATPGVTHSYCIIAYSDGGGRSAGVCDDGTQSVVLAPYDVAASDGVKENRTEITWESSSTTAVLFKIFRDDTFIKSVGANTHSHDDYGGTAGQVYDYSVVAVTAMGDESAAAADSGYRELRVPGAVAASDEEYEEKIVVTWADNSAYEDGYIISRQDSATAVVDSVWTLGPNRTSYTDYTAVPGVTYRYDIVAFDTKGEAQGESESAGDEGRRILLPPTNVQATDGKYETKVEIIWDDNSTAEDGYRIYRDGALIDSVPDNFTSYVDTSPLFGETCEYSVAAYDGLTSGESEWGSDSGSTVILPPASFNASDVYLHRIEVELTWVDVSQVEAGYEIFRDGAPIDTTGANATAYTDVPDPCEPPLHEYCIRAIRGNIASETVCDDGVRGVGPINMLLANDRDDGDGYGLSVAVDGDWAIVGATYDDENGTDTGAAYIYKKRDDDTWCYFTKLMSDLGPGAAADRFGCAVGISSTFRGDFAIVGAWGDNERGGNAGAAYIFERSGDSWERAARLVPADLNPDDRFGSSVGIAFERAVVGAPLHDGTAADGGAAYAYARVAGVWGYETKLQDFSTPAASDHFGTSVAITGNQPGAAEFPDTSTYLIVGVPGKDTPGGTDIGIACRFRNWRDKSPGSWNSLGVLSAADGAAYDLLGSSVAAYGYQTVIGAPGDDDNGPSSGSVYLFGYLEGKLTAPDGYDGDEFGRSVAIKSFDDLLVGAPYDDDNGLESGSAYLFEYDGSDNWTPRPKLLPDGGAAGDRFGHCVSVDDAMTCFVGAPYRDSSEGAVYVFQTESDPPTEPELPQTIVFASDGTFTTRVRVTWEDTYTGEDGFYVYRNAELIDSTAANMESYDDTEAQPGRTYEYCVAPYSGGVELAHGCDFGWRPPNGNITGQISTLMGAGV
ncbi:MAG TPA: Ig-like domain-containing protein, partial [Acidobacteriota bacterium]|nr:Ig-like domain-containing protein [Acidobacteriota bacterium]